MSAKKKLIVVTKKYRVTTPSAGWNNRCVFDSLDEATDYLSERLWQYYGRAEIVEVYEVREDKS